MRIRSACERDILEIGLSMGADASTVSILTIGFIGLRIPVMIDGVAAELAASNGAVEERGWCERQRSHRGARFRGEIAG
jgi:hypothetical protein